jgi:putative spermidine/putrescine transport system permease protein
MNKGLTGGAFLLLLPAIIFVLLLFIGPFVYGLILSFTTQDGKFTLGNFIQFFSEPYDFETIRTTLWIAVPATLINVALAVPFAYYMRHGMKGERIITFFLILPITLGTVLLSEGMLRYMGAVGWLNQLLMALHIVKEPFQFVHNRLGVMLSLIIQGFPFAFLMILGYVSGINPDLEKASQMLGATRFQTFWKVLFPLMVPGIAICLCLVFVMEFTVFPSAVMLGQPSGPTRVMSIAAYHWFMEKFNWNVASAITVIMAAIELTVISVILVGRNRLYRGASMVGKG